MSLRLTLSSRIGLAVAVAGVVATSVTALVVAPPPGSTPGEALSVAATQLEYDHERQLLAESGYLLAPGWQWPDELDLGNTGPDGAPMTYEEGYGAMRADTIWFYSWAELAVSTNVPATRADALRRLTGVRDLTFYKKRLPEDQAYVDLMLTDAERGDLTKLAEYVEANIHVDASGGDRL